MSSSNASSAVPRLILGSSSKWRRQALTDAGFAFETDSPEIDESAIFEESLLDGGSAMTIAIQIAEAKAEVLLPRYAGQDVLIVAGDQLVEFMGEPRGKPRDAEQARAWLRGYRGAEVSMIAALAVVHAREGIIVSGTETAVASYAEIADEAIERAIASGDVLHSCGAVVLEDKAISPYVVLKQGTLDSVAGMPILLLRELLGPRLRRFNA